MNPSGAMQESVITQRECYTAPLAQMSFPFRLRVLSCCLVFISTSLSVRTAIAQNAETSANPYAKAAVEFVAEVMSRAGSPSLIALTFENKSSLTGAEVSQIRKAIDAQFRASNVRMVKSERALAEINVTISENAQGLLWVAEIKQGLSTHIAMLPVLRATPSVAIRPPTLSIRRTAVFVQNDHQPILDFKVTDAKILLVLNPEQLATYSPESGKWRARNALPIKHSQPWPRDLRGRIFVRDSQLQISMPGVRCTGMLDATSTLNAFDCIESDDPWPIAFDNGVSLNAFYVPTKNYFTGLLSASGSDQAVPAFYSGSSIGDTFGSWIFAGTDGRTRLYSSLKQQPVILSGLGSDLASVKSDCGSKWQVLVTRPGDRTQSDAVQALEIANREATPVSAPMEFPGPITALWPMPDHNSVNLIFHDLANGNHEATTLTITCDQ